MDNQLKQKITTWLTEEQFTVKEKADPKTYFNLEITKGRTVANVAAPLSSSSIIVGGGIAIDPQTVSAYQELEDDKKKACVDELMMYLITNPSVAEYSIGPNPPSDFRQVRCVSKPLFTDTLTKERVISRIIDVHKVWLAVQAILSKYTGFLAPGRADSSASFYG